MFDEESVPVSHAGYSRFCAYVTSVGSELANLFVTVLRHRRRRKQRKEAIDKKWKCEIDDGCNWIRDVETGFLGKHRERCASGIIMISVSVLDTLSA